MRRLKALLASPGFNLFVGLLIIISVGLLGYEVFAKPDGVLLGRILLIQDLILILLVMELGLRWKASPSTAAFFRKHWLEILAILPMLRVFRLGRIAILLRLVQLLSFGAIFQRRLSRLQALFNSRWPEYAVLFGFTLFALIFGAIGLAEFEQGSTIKSTDEAFWQALFSLLAGEYADYPETLGGRLVFLVLVLFGMGIFAMLTGTISAFMMDKLKEEDMSVIQDAGGISQHIVICGFTSKTEVLIRELLADSEHASRDIILISSQAGMRELKNMGLNSERVMVMTEDFTQAEVLRRAGLDRAVTAMILAEESAGRSSQDTDARTILAALTIEKMNPSIHSVAELNHAEYLDHLKMGGVDDVILQGEVCGRLLGRAGLSRGMLPFFEDLLTHQSGNGLSFRPLPKGMEGRIMSEALSELYAILGGIVVGLRAQGSRELEVNPQSRRLKNGDELLVILPWNKIPKGR